MMHGQKNIKLLRLYDWCKYT